VIDGQHIFSDAPCGEHATIRHLKELNVMDAPAPDSRAYGYPQSPPYYPPAYAPSDDAGYDYDSGSPAVLWIHGLARGNNFARHDGRVHPHPHPQARRN
jgi:hypothetical protein